MRSNTTTWYRLLYWAPVWCLAAFWIAGCNDNPSGVGSGFLPENVEFRTYTLSLEEFTIQSGIASFPNSSNSGGSSILVGTAPDGTIAHSLLAISEVSNRLENIDASQIVEATLRLRTFSYRYGDTASRKIAFDVVAYNGVFGSAAQWVDTITTKINNGGVIGSYDGAYPDSAVITVQLSASEIATFLNNYFKRDTLITTGGTKPDTIPQTITLQTLALRAKSNPGMIGSFLGSTFVGLSDSLKPTLRVRLADTTVDLPIAVSTWIARMPESFPVGGSAIVAAGGAPLRTYIKFSLDSIPPTAVIHQVRLTLQANPALSSRGSTSITTSAIMYIGDKNPLDQENYLAPGSRFVRGFRNTIDSTTFGNTFTFSALAELITQWARYNRGVRTGQALENNGLVLAMERSFPNLEGGAVDRLAFYGFDAADPELRPKLTIIYSTQVNAQ